MANDLEKENTLDLASELGSRIALEKASGYITCDECHSAQIRFESNDEEPDECLEDVFFNALVNDGWCVETAICEDCKDHIANDLAREDAEERREGCCE